MKFQHFIKEFSRRNIEVEEESLIPDWGIGRMLNTGLLRLVVTCDSGHGMDISTLELSGLDNFDSDLIKQIQYIVLYIC